jgi:hypothetical protein
LPLRLPERTLRWLCTATQMVCPHPIIGAQLALCIAVLFQEPPVSASEHQETWPSDPNSEDSLQLTPEQITCLQQFKDFPEEYRSAYLDGTCFVTGPPRQRLRSMQAPLLDFAPLDFSPGALQPN